MGWNQGSMRGIINTERLHGMGSRRDKGDYKHNERLYRMRSRKDEGDFKHSYRLQLCMILLTIKGS